MLRRDAQARDVIVRDASAEALFPHQPQFQPEPRLPLGLDIPAGAAEARATANVVNGNMQASKPYRLTQHRAATICLSATYCRRKASPTLLQPHVELSTDDFPLNSHSTLACHSWPSMLVELLAAVTHQQRGGKSLLTRRKG